VNKITETFSNRLNFKSSKNFKFPRYLQNLITFYLFCYLLGNPAFNELLELIFVLRDSF